MEEICAHNLFFVPGSAQAPIPRLGKLAVVGAIIAATAYLVIAIRADKKALSIEHVPPSEMSAIVFEDVSFGYGGGLGMKAAAPVLDGLSLNVADGAIYGLLGPSGCGKTTLLSCCLGVLSPRSGTVLLFGQKPHAKGTPHSAFVSTGCLKCQV